MPIILALLGGGALGTALGWYLWNRPAAPAAPGVQVGPASEPRPNIATGPRFSGDPNFSQGTPVAPQSPATLTGVPWWDSKPPIVE